MLAELRVRDLGVIEDLGLVLQPGMTAVTGETGAGKTLVVEAIELLVGERADAALVRPGADEAVAEGRFLTGDDEVVIVRVIPRSGRSRAYVNGRLATVSELTELGRGLVDLHGQHAHQSLLSTPVQRAALDRFGAIDLRPLAEARANLTAVEQRLAALGGDSRSRAREADLLRYQLAELEAAALSDPAEEELLEAEEDRLAGAREHREAAMAAGELLAGEGGAGDAVGGALAAVGSRGPFSEVAARLRAAAAELAEAAGDLRRMSETFDDDPDRLEAVRTRRRLLTELRRKYGESLSQVMAYQTEAAERLAQLDRHDERVAELERDRLAAAAAVRSAAAEVGRRRREQAPRLADAVTAHLRRLAMPRARLAVEVGGPARSEDPDHLDAGEDVAFLLAANQGEPLLPLAKAASGGELARAMLAARLVLTEGPPTLVFDEVDAGIGGEAALAVGRALAALAAERQVLVVTHLPQVAAFADHQVAVTKSERGGRTVAGAASLSSSERVVELSRMLSGRPGSDTARTHAQELLAAAARERGPDEGGRVTIGRGGPPASGREA